QHGEQRHQPVRRVRAEHRGHVAGAGPPDPQPGRGAFHGGGEDGAGYALAAGGRDGRGEGRGAEPVEQPAGERRRGSTSVGSGDRVVPHGVVSLRARWLLPPAARPPPRGPGPSGGRRRAARGTPPRRLRQPGSSRPLHVASPVAPCPPPRVSPLSAPGGGRSSSESAVPERASASRPREVAKRGRAARTASAGLRGAPEARTSKARGAARRPPPGRAGSASPCP